MIALPLGVAGLGLIGGSIALRARAAGVHVIGFDRDSTSMERARARGAIDEESNDLVSLAQRSGTLVIALPLEATVAALERLSGVDTPALMLDVASVKAPLVRFRATFARFVPSHPMAGRENGGIAAADATLFVDATWAYVPPSEPQPAAQARAFIEMMGAVPLPIDAERHDAIVALTSHLPQVVSVVLGAQIAAAAQAEPDVMQLCGPGMMSMLRLARSPWSMWDPIVSANAGPLAGRLRALADALVTVADEIDEGDSARLMPYFEIARNISEVLADRFGRAARS